MKKELCDPCEWMKRMMAVKDGESVAVPEKCTDCEYRTGKPDCCGNCVFSKDTEVKNFDTRLFACRRYPPQQGDRQDRPGLYPFPIVKETEWCGEHKPERKTDGKEEK